MSAIQERQRGNSPGTVLHWLADGSAAAAVTGAETIGRPAAEFERLAEYAVQLPR